MRRCRSTLQAGTCDAQATTVLRPQNQRNHTSRGTQGSCPLWKSTRRSPALTSAAPMSAGPPPRQLVKAEAHALQPHRRVGWLEADPVLHARASARSGWPGGYCRLHGSPRPYYRACCGADSLAGGTPANSQARGPAHVLQLRQQGRRRGRKATRWTCSTQCWARTPGQARELDGRHQIKNPSDLARDALPARCPNFVWQQPTQTRPVLSALCHKVNKRNSV